MIYLFVIMIAIHTSFSFFFFNDTATTEIYTLSLHDALPICAQAERGHHGSERGSRCHAGLSKSKQGDRKSTRLNSSHLVISYAVFCLKKKKTNIRVCYIQMYCASTRRTDRNLM